MEQAKPCGCKPLVLEPAEITPDTKEVKITRVMCQAHAADYFLELQKNAAGTN